MTPYAYAYDANGNLTCVMLGGCSSEDDYRYTAENQLVYAHQPGAQYSYGPAARRVRKNVNGVVTNFLHAGDMEIAEYDGSGNLLRRYIPGPGVDQRVALIECDTAQAASQCRPGGTGAQARYYFADRQGNVLAVADEDGTLNQRFVYTPFGVELVGDEAGNPFRYTGRRYDPETRLYYYRARYYDADLGRFLQVDPIGYEDQWNLYAYVGNNPLNAIDPTGMQAQPVPPPEPSRPLPRRPNTRPPPNASNSRANGTDSRFNLRVLGRLAGLAMVGESLQRRNDEVSATIEG